MGGLLQLQRGVPVWDRGCQNGGFRNGPSGIRHALGDSSGFDGSDRMGPADLAARFAIQFVARAPGRLRWSRDGACRHPERLQEQLRCDYSKWMDADDYLHLPGASDWDAACDCHDDAGLLAVPVVQLAKDGSLFPAPTTGVVGSAEHLAWYLRRAEGHGLHHARAGY